MKVRSALFILIGLLVLGSSSSASAADPTPSRADIVKSIQNQYNPLFNSQYARLGAIQKKVSTDSGSLRVYGALLADFLDMRRILASGLASSTSDLDALKSYVEATAAKIRTIICFKAKLVKKVTGLVPKCLNGYNSK
jgi:hypothetical protein